MLATMPNHMPTVALHETHILPLPQCCPVSGNPQAGSSIRISYLPADCFLEVYSLKAYISRFVGGLHDDTTFVRDMEQLVQRIAQDCANALQVRVNVRAILVLQPVQQMHLRARATPQVLLDQPNLSIPEHSDSSTTCPFITGS